MGLISRVSSRTYRNQNKKPLQKCRSPSISSTQLWPKKKPSTRKSDWCKLQTASSWTSNAQTALKSEPSSATLKPSSFAKVAVKSCPNPPVARPDSLLAAVSERSKTSKLFRASMGKPEKLKKSLINLFENLIE